MISKDQSSTVTDLSDEEIELAKLLTSVPALHADAYTPIGFVSIGTALRIMKFIRAMGYTLRREENHD